MASSMGLYGPRPTAPASCQLIAFQRARPRGVRIYCTDPLTG